MPRPLRIQYPGAIYHVVNRGNYRQELFRSEGASESFLLAVKEAVGLYGWQLHAYVVMSNHFHLVLETPEPNLVDGMHWLESTFGTRFNRFRKEQGHLFQGRYHSGLIEDRSGMAHVVDYVHLNPVRAKIVLPEQSEAYRWSSLGAFVRGEGFPGLVAKDWLAIHALEEKAEGWRAYLKHLTPLAGNLEEQARLGWKKFSKAWALGTDAWKKQVLADHAGLKLARGLSKDVLADMKAHRWQGALNEALRRHDLELKRFHAAKKSEAWKLDFALELRGSSGASLTWLAKTLNLGTPDTARSKLSHHSKQKKQQNSA